mmetsp:Transcript_38285/g.89601  ORF Transcript_38285/g.89601 Transcript_38285/m.89601 type:complete len:217 (+) Transcript_38285:857-1507(+)
MHAGEAGELAQLLDGESGVQHATASQKHHLLHFGRGERMCRVLRNIRGAKLLYALAQDSSTIERDVAMADNHRSLCVREAEVEASGARVAVVPLHELSRGVHTRKPCARKPNPTVGRGAVCEYNRIVVLLQLRKGETCGLRRGREVAANADIAKVVDARVARNLREALCHLLHVLVVGSHAKPHEAKRNRQLLEKRDAHAHCLLKEMIYHIKAGGP